MDELSIRESQIIRLIAAGMTTKAIAATLSIAESTVNWHVGNVLAKLGASSRAEAVAIVLRDGPPETPLVIVTQSPRRIGRWVAAAVAVAFILALAGGTTVAAWYFGARQNAPLRPETAPPIATETATALPSAGGVAPAGPPPSASSSAGPPAGPAPTGPPTDPPALPLATPRLTAPTSVPAISLPPVPTLPSLPIPPILGGIGP